VSVQGINLFGIQFSSRLRVHLRWRSVRLLEGRDVRELRWIATHLNAALGLPTSRRGILQDPSL
jgi:hypothetical protein